jgi:hypothetical protein
VKPDLRVDMSLSPTGRFFAPWIQIARVALTFN